MPKERVEIPDDVELLLHRWATSCEGGLADDALVELSTATGKPLGRMTLGWFRENTSFGPYEGLNREDDEDAEGC